MGRGHETASEEGSFNILMSFIPFFHASGLSCACQGHNDNQPVKRTY